MANFVRAGIVTNGLQLYFDFLNAKSYTGTGTAITNLVTKAQTDTIVGAPTWQNTSLLFAAGKYLDFTVANVGTTMTIDTWIYPTGWGGMFFGWYNYDVWTNNGAIGYNTANGDQYGMGATNVSSWSCLNAWRHYTFEMRSDVSYTNNKIYINGVQQTLSQIAGSESSLYRVFNSGAGRISGWRRDTSYGQSMYMSMFRVYNRALTVDEINQNYLAHRKKHGL